MLSHGLFLVVWLARPLLAKNGNQNLVGCCRSLKAVTGAGSANHSGTPYHFLIQSRPRVSLTWGAYMVSKWCLSVGWDLPAVTTGSKSGMVCHYGSQNLLLVLWINFHMPRKTGVFRRVFWDRKFTKRHLGSFLIWTKMTIFGHFAALFVRGMRFFVLRARRRVILVKILPWDTMAVFGHFRPKLA